MSLASIVKDACERLDLPVAELARRTNQSPQNLGKKLRNETLNYEEFTEALSCLGVQYEYRLVFPDEEPEEMASERARDMNGILSGQIMVQRKTIGLLQSIARDIQNEVGFIESTADAALKRGSAPNRSVRGGFHCRFLGRRVWAARLWDTLMS